MFKIPDSASYEGINIFYFFNETYFDYPLIADKKKLMLS